VSNATIRRSVVGPLVIVALAVTVWSAVAQAGPTPTPTGGVVGWGFDGDGQATPPDDVNGVTGTATEIAASRYQSCAIQAGTGNVVCWDWDYNGLLTPPDAVNGVSGTATDIAMGRLHSCAIQAVTGNVVCWGYEDYGQATPPDDVNGVSGTATDIAAGERHSCAVQAGTGNVVCWGRSNNGQATPPDDVNGVSGTATDIAAGRAHSCAIQAGAGEVVCWGYDGQGQATPPDAVNGVLGTASAIAAGSGHSCAIQAGTGEVVCWGSNSNGQAWPPYAVNGDSGTASAIAAGIAHSCAIQAGTDKVVCWGSNSNGQATPPAAVNGVLGTATEIAAGSHHTLAIGAPPMLTKAQQACVNEMNKNGEKVNRTQLKENERCLNDFQREKLVAPMTFDACMAADRKDRVLKAKAKTATQEAKKCDPLEVAPPFAHNDSATVNAAAVDGALALTRKIFGRSPVLDDDLATKAADKDMAKCQLEMLKRADKLVNTVLKEVIKAEKKALKDETVHSSEALEAKLQTVFSSNERIDRTQATLVKGVDKKCAVLQAAPDTIFPGACGEGSPNLNEVEACVIATARCEAWDDRTSNGSCP